MKTETQEQPTPPARRPYEAPAVISEEIFETLALSCASANPLVCKADGKS